ncbi:MAG: glycosyltransferase family 2 protein [Chloroflexota bacterium]
MTDLWISVVSYRTPGLLRDCLTALDRERADLACEVIVVDNNSQDESCDMVEREFPWVRLIRNAINVGFGAAHNQALRHVHGRYAVIMNSDAVPQPGALRRLVEYMDTHPDVALCGPRLRYPDGTIQPSRRRFPTLATFFLESTQLQRLLGQTPTIRRYYLTDQPDDVAQDVDWLVGACLCVRSAAVEDVGLFDERFFMYSEEVDWARRFRAAGWRVAYVPQAEVQHLESGSASLDLMARDRYFQTSKRRYIRKWHGPLAEQAFRLYLAAEYIARAAEESVKLVGGSRRDEHRTRLRAIRNGLRHTLRG